MTTYQTPVQPDPYYNKALAAAIVFLIALIVQLAISDWGFGWKQEGVTIITGVIVVALVTALSNHKSYLKR